MSITANDISKLRDEVSNYTISIHYREKCFAFIWQYKIKCAHHIKYCALTKLQLHVCNTQSLVDNITT